MTLSLLLLFGGVIGLELKESAQSRGTELSIEEVAEVRCEDPELAERVRKLSLGNAPSPGFERVMTAPRLREALVRAGLGEAQVSGAGACRVRSAEERVSGAEILRQAEAELRRSLAELGEYELRPLVHLPEAIVPAGDIPYALTARVDPQNLSAGSLSVPVQILVDGTAWRTVWTSWAVERWTTVPVLRRAVQAGERLLPELFETQRVKLQDASAASLERGQLVGAVARRSLPIGAQVGSQDVERPQLVRAGDTIHLQIRKGGVVARVPAVAREAAALGDRIRVIASDTGLELSGRLLARDLVEIDLGGAR